MYTHLDDPSPALPSPALRQSVLRAGRARRRRAVLSVAASTVVLALLGATVLARYGGDDRRGDSVVTEPDVASAARTSARVGIWPFATLADAKVGTNPPGVDVNDPVSVANGFRLHYLYLPDHAVVQSAEPASSGDPDVYLDIRTSAANGSRLVTRLLLRDVGLRVEGGPYVVVRADADVRGEVLSVLDPGPGDELGDDLRGNTGFTGPLTVTVRDAPARQSGETWTTPRAVGQGHAGVAPGSWSAAVQRSDSVAADRTSGAVVITLGDSADPDAMAVVPVELTPTESESTTAGSDEVTRAEALAAELGCQDTRVGDPRSEPDGPVPQAVPQQVVHCRLASSLGGFAVGIRTYRNAAEVDLALEFLMRFDGTRTIGPDWIVAMDVPEAATAVQRVIGGHVVELGSQPGQQGPNPCRPARLELSATRVRAGDTVRVSSKPAPCTLYAEGKTYQARLLFVGRADPVVLGEVPVAPDGSFAVDLVVPRAASPGEAAIKMDGSAFDGVCDGPAAAHVSCATYLVPFEILAPG